MRIPTATVLAILLSVGPLGCGDDSGSSEPVPVLLEELPCQGVDEVGIWQSAPPAEFAVGGCQWFRFRGNTTYVFDHPLGRVPSIVLGYIAFTPDGVGATLASGNEFLELARTETTVTLRNGQNQEFWLRLALF